MADYVDTIFTSVYAVVRNKRLRATTVIMTCSAFTNWYEATTGGYGPSEALEAVRAGELDLSDWEIVGGYLYDLLYIENLEQIGV